MKKVLPFIYFLIAAIPAANSQNCNPQGDQTSFGTNNTWIGYVYNTMNFNSYKGYINTGTANSPDFDTNFGGADITLATTGCSVRTEKFSVRFKLAKTVSSGTYKITVGGDDGYRFSLDGGNSWIINAWSDHTYQTSVYIITLSGNCNMVLEYYDNTGDNRVSFSMAPYNCGSSNSETYGHNNIWNGYLYAGTGFSSYAGMVNAGNVADAAFTEAFGGSDVYFNTGCSHLRTEKFSARYRLTKTFENALYTFNVGADDGYRLSLDGGNTWVINKWSDHPYITTTLTVQLNGTYNMVLEYYDNSAENILSFFVQRGTVLAAKEFILTGREQNGNALLNWQLSTGSNAAFFELEKSSNGSSFNTVNNIPASTGITSGAFLKYTATDKLTGNDLQYYRVKMTGTDGAVSWSNNIVLQPARQTGAGIRIFPAVVTNGIIQVNCSSTLSNAVIRLHDFSGAAISNRYLGKLAANQSAGITITNGQISPGIYLVSVVDEGRLVGTQKIMIQ
ncbi:MAG: hypothetical protein ACKOU7_07445 [Ferruginibacter sp.]